MARRVFDRVGGCDWAQTRQWVYAGASRGQLGTLALAVAAAADEDPAAMAILQAAGTELARLALALLQRFGTLPVALPIALAGRVFELHPVIGAQLRQALPTGTSIQRLLQPADVEAARMASNAVIPIVRRKPKS